MVVVCDICGSSGIRQWGRSNFWGQVSCLAHVQSPHTRRCCTCSRLKPWNVNYIDLGDGRHLCPDCRSVSSIMGIDQCKPLERHVRSFFKHHLKLKIKKNIPILLVDSHELGRIFRYQYRTINGGTVWSQSEVITTVAECIQRSNRMQVVTEDVWLTCINSPAILLAFGRPRLKSGATLAHEMMHVWFRSQGRRYRGLEREIEEGMCELVAHEWLKCWNPRDPSYTNEQAQFAENLHKYEMLNIESGSSIYYEHGFRKAKQAVEKYGFKKALDHIAPAGCSCFGC